ncbi:hypothetical protein Cpir12675_000074 [Ceratocystis pirilliformis]|uniref:Selenoprotein O n=1 Tax=Ceratocystis pirilliformis TaxID=259994 RepID=A0ABR3ZPS9_9PEZI
MTTSPLHSQLSSRAPRLSIGELPKSWTFTSKLPADPKFPSPKASYETPRHHITPRPVHESLFSYVRPEPAESPELLAVSPAALETLSIAPESVASLEFLNTVSGNLLHGWDDKSVLDGTTGSTSNTANTQYPWAQCYGGFQFGSWAGQLGDGRAISLFETTSPATGQRYELQLKGAGLTPYSRFADGKAVLRSSIREFLASEALHALGIATTRALSLTKLPHASAARETIEPCAIVLRFAPSWIRIGTFDLPRVRQDYATVRLLAEYVAEEVYGGWEALPGRLAETEAPSSAPLEEPCLGVAAEETEGSESLAQENRFARLYRAIVRRNAAACASWMVYGFMNGVLNTDNTSVLGLSMDYGPFAFIDVFDPLYTPNHDDITLRYSYRNQPTIIWWNLVRLGEDLAPLIGAGDKVDQINLHTHDDLLKHQEDIVPRAEALIGQAGKEYKAVFTAEYRRLMLRRLGLRDSLTHADADIAKFLPDMLDVLAACKLDFHQFFRTLSSTPLSAFVSETQNEVDTMSVVPETASRLFDVAGLVPEDARIKLAEWLSQWGTRVAAEWPTVADSERQQAMKKVNPNFVLRSWILTEIIDRVQKDSDTDVLRRAMHMALHPFEDEWTGRIFDGQVYQGDKAEEERWTGPVPETKVGMQCSCSS